MATRLLPAGGPEVDCVFCGESSLEYLYIVVAVFPEREQFVCRCCAPVVPGGLGAWEAAETEHRIEGEGDTPVRGASLGTGRSRALPPVAALSATLSGIWERISGQLRHVPGLR